MRFSDRKKIQFFRPFLFKILLIKVKFIMIYTATFAKSLCYLVEYLTSNHEHWMYNRSRKFLWCLFAHTPTQWEKENEKDEREIEEKTISSFILLPVWVLIRWRLLSSIFFNTFIFVSMMLNDDWLYTIVYISGLCSTTRKRYFIYV